MKVYNIPLQTNHLFQFYTNNKNELLCVNDVSEPYSVTEDSWDYKKGFTFTINNVYGNSRYIYSGNSFLIKENEIFLFLKERITLEYTNIAYLNDADFNEYNLFVAYKDLNNNFIEVLTLASKATGKHLNQPMTNILQKYIDLQIFS